MATSHRRPLLLALALLLALLPLARPAQAAGLTVVSQTALSERLREVVVFSPAMERETTLRVLLPTGYDPKADVDYPVLYLLHGCCDTYRSWSDKTDLEAFTADLDVVVVMPDAGQAGFYSDWYRHGLGGPPRWEGYHIAELIPWVERTYDVRAERSGRLLAGLSMGGFGSFSYAARHPDLFVSAAAYSPAVDTNFLDPVGLDLGILDGGPYGSIWGPRATEEVRWRGHNPWDLAENLATLDLWLITGDGTNAEGVVTDPVEFGVHEMAVSLHGRLEELGVAHYWEDYGPGGHTWDLWQRDLHFTLPRQLAEAQARAADPVAFTHTATEPAYDVFGWDVAIGRSVLEFSRLEVGGAGGFAVEGSGTAYVTTAPLYAPGSAHTATIGGVPAPVVADTDGRLTVVLDLGAAHTAQQFTPAADALAEPFGRVEVTIA